MKFNTFAAPITDVDDIAYDVPCVVALDEHSKAGSTLSDADIAAIALCLKEYASDTCSSATSHWYSQGLANALR